MWGCESWTTKKAERRRADALSKLWCWRRLLRVPWTARKSHKSILKEINPGNSLEGLMLKLKLQYFGHLMWRTDVGKDPDAGKEWRQEEKGTTENEMVGWHHQLDGQWIWASSGSWWWTGKPGVLQSTGSQRVGQNLATELNSFTLISNAYFSDTNCLTHWWQDLIRISWDHFGFLCGATVMITTTDSNHLATTDTLLHHGSCSQIYGLIDAETQSTSSKPSTTLPKVLFQN